MKVGKLLTIVQKSVAKWENVGIILLFWTHFK